MFWCCQNVIPRVIMKNSTSVPSVDVVLVEYSKFIIVHFHLLMLKISKMYNFTGAAIFDFDV